MVPLSTLLARYGLAVAGLRWVPVGGGFSGASVWRGEEDSPVFALKAFPPDLTPEHLARVHAWVRRAAHLTFVPAIIPATDGATVVSEAGRVWELSRWIVGEPELRRDPTPARLASAVAALAELHLTWKPAVPQLAPCPGVQRRIAILRQWQSHPVRHADELLRRASDHVSRLAPLTLRALVEVESQPVPVQPCLCDIHADHVLFRGDEVVGVIDFAAMKEDHVAIDLARLLGSAVGDDEQQFVAAISEYHARGGQLISAEFIRLLDRTGTICAAATWCRRSAGAIPHPVRDRVTHLCARLEGWVASQLFPSS